MRDAFRGFEWLEVSEFDGLFEDWTPDPDWLGQISGAIESGILHFPDPSDQEKARRLLRQLNKENDFVFYWQLRTLVERRGCWLV